MIATYLSPLINVLLIAGFITDRVFRLHSIKEYKNAKEAQITMLLQQLELERSNNDIKITEMHKVRYENLKLLLDEKELEVDANLEALLEFQIALQGDAAKNDLLDRVINELTRVDRSKLSVELKRKIFLHQLKSRD